MEMPKARGDLLHPQNLKVAGKPNRKNAALAVARGGAVTKDVGAFFQPNLEHRRPLLAAISFLWLLLRAPGPREQTTHTVCAKREP